MTIDEAGLGPKAMRTRAAILDAAARRFERHGFGGTTIRAVADDVGIDPAMVMRYFGSKGGLFAAASSFDLGLERFDGHPASELGRSLARHVIATWGSDGIGRRLRILLAAAPTDPDAAARIGQVLADQVLPMVRRVRDDAEPCAAFVAAQILGFAFSRYVLPSGPMRAMGDDEAAAWLGDSLQELLDRPR